MRIGMMADTYKPYVSGITNYIDLNKRALESAGHEVYVFTFGDMDYQDDEPRVIRSPGLPLADTGFYLSLRYNTPARKLLQSMDIVHVHHPFLSGRLALRYCLSKQIPVVFTNHTRYDLYAQARLPNLPEEVSLGLLQAYMPDFCEAVSLVISPSDGMKKILRDFKVASHIEVVPNGANLKPFQTTKPLSRMDFGFNNNDILLVYAGRIAPEKNLDFLFQAFAGVSRILPNVYLLIIGGGQKEHEEALHLLSEKYGIHDRIRFTGIISYDQLPAYLAMCDVFVTASVTEVHPLSVIEAMASGLPVVGIHSPGISDSITDGVTGLLSTDDIASYTAKLMYLCLNKDLQKKFGAEALKASEQYSIERTTKIMLGHYIRLIENTKPIKQKLDERLKSILEEFLMNHNQRIGKWGEENAAEYLLQLKYEIIARNVRTPYGEIDIIARQNDITIFVEVKTRTSNTMGLPEEAITPRKREHMLASADYYAAEHALDHWQIDVISIEGKPGSKPKITHFENAL